MPKKTNNKLSLFSWLNKQTDLKGQHSFMLFYFIFLYVADPAIFLAPKQCSGTLFSSKNSLFIHLRKKCIYLSLYYYLNNIVNIKILKSILIQKCPLKGSLILMPLKHFLFTSVKNFQELYSSIYQTFKTLQKPLYNFYFEFQIFWCILVVVVK